MNQVADDLMAVLACPKCKSSVKATADHIQCTNESCALRYPVRDGIPIMLIDEATRHTDKAQESGVEPPHSKT